MPPSPDFSAADLRRAMLEAALDEWSKVVRDDDRGVPGDREVIAGYFRANGWGAWLDNVTGGGYVEHSRTSWCGQFAAAMGQRVGDYLVDGQCVGIGLDDDLARGVIVSTARLADRKKWRAAGFDMPTHYRASTVPSMLQRSGDGQLVEAASVLFPGVVATFKTSGRKPQIGDHIVIVERFDPETGLVHTVEGNGRGELGDGSSGEGVIRTTRRLADLRRVYPLELEHFE